MMPGSVFREGGRFTSQLAEIPWSQLPNPAHC
jgi:hypothetical protein